MKQNLPFTYDISQVATSYAQLCAVLAGFAFMTLSAILLKQVPPATIKDRVRAQLVELLFISFFGLIGSAVLQTIRSGIKIESINLETIKTENLNTVIEEHNRLYFFGMVFTFTVDFMMVVSIISVFGVIFMMLFNGIEFSSQNRKRFVYAFLLITIASYWFSHVTAVDLLNLVNDIKLYRSITWIHISHEFMIPLGVYYLSRKK